MDTILDTASRHVTCRPWADLKAALDGGYVPTIYPESEQHCCLRRAVVRAGYRVFPEPQVKLVNLTGTQAFRIDDYLELTESGSDRRTVRSAKRAVLTKTTVTLDYSLAAELVEWLEWTKDTEVEAAGYGQAQTPNEADFAERSVARSFDALIRKVKFALRRAQ